MEEATLDKWGRVIIPREIRETLGLRPNQKLIVETKGKEIVLRPVIQVETFSKELRGCVHGSKVEPMKLKENWGITHAHS